MADSNKSPKLEIPLPTQPEYPRPFGSYLLLHRIARGGMGEVFLAKHGGIAGIEKHCVVKTLRPHYTADREYVTRFIDEARVVVQLNHRNIAQIFDVGRVNKQYYLAMEFVAGRDLRSITERLARKGQKLPENIALHIVGEVLEALDYSHRHVDTNTGQPMNLVHRDISPQNVMVSFEGEVKLIDFGLAHSTMKVEKTQPNVVMGKMAYMAPEQARGDELDSRADLFAAGVLLYELLSHERYYEGLGFDQIWGLAGSGGHRPRLLGQLHEQLQSVLAKSVAPQVDERYSRGSDFKDDLVEYQVARGLRPVSRELREFMNELFAEESATHMELIARFKNVSAIGSGSGPASPPEESQSFAVASVESFLDGAPIPDRAATEGKEPPSFDPAASETAVSADHKSDVIPLRRNDTMVAEVGDVTAVQSQFETDDRSTVLQSSDAGATPGDSGTDEAPPDVSDTGPAAAVSGGQASAPELNPPITGVDSGGHPNAEFTPATGSLPEGHAPEESTFLPRAPLAPDPTTVLVRPLSEVDTAANVVAAGLGRPKRNTLVLAMLGISAFLLVGVILVLVLLPEQEGGQTVAAAGSASGDEVASTAKKDEAPPSSTGPNANNAADTQPAKASQGAGDKKRTDDARAEDDAEPGGEEAARAAPAAVKTSAAVEDQPRDAPQADEDEDDAPRVDREAKEARTAAKSSARSSSKKRSRRPKRASASKKASKPVKAPEPPPKKEEPPKAKPKLPAAAVKMTFDTKLQVVSFFKLYKSDCMAVGARCAKDFNTTKLRRLYGKDSAAWEKKVTALTKCARKCQRLGRKER